MAALSRAKSRKAEVAIYARLLDHLTAFRRIPVLGYDERAAAIASAFQDQRLRVGAMDLKIASITRAHQGTLITRNLSDFRKIAGLTIEDWTSE